MNEVAEIPALAAILTSTLMILGAAITLIGSLGLLRLPDFYQRVHAPTLGTTLGVICITMASMIYFSVLGTRPVLHELLVIVFVVTTTPITLMILVRAALFRDEPNDVLENKEAGVTSPRETRPRYPRSEIAEPPP
jgi:multicomponent K+:H+ antiporter subunit G